MQTRSATIPSDGQWGRSFNSERTKGVRGMRGTELRSSTAARRINTGDIVEVTGPFPTRLGLASVRKAMTIGALVDFPDGRHALIDYPHLERVEL